MLLIARVGFAGKLSMYKGEIREVPDGEIVRDLLRAGYVEPYAQEAVVVSKKENTTPKKPATKKTKKK